MMLDNNKKTSHTQLYKIENILMQNNKNIFNF